MTWWFLGPFCHHRTAFLPKPSVRSRTVRVKLRSRGTANHRRFRIKQDCAFTGTTVLTSRLKPATSVMSSLVCVMCHTPRKPDGMGGFF
jgi:hypothetical protein